MRFIAASLLIFALAGCTPQPPVTKSTSIAKSSGPSPLVEARRGFKSKLVSREPGHAAVEKPPENIFRQIQYKSANLELDAYVSPDPGDGRKHPAIVWIHGGLCNVIGDCWSPMPEENEQSASIYRRSGIIQMFPALRGGHANSGQREGYLGEVDDVVAAGDFLAGQSYVDPQRIYLGGHSTGGTMALLAAASSNRFRAVFSFGPAADIRGYGQRDLPFDPSNPREFELRSPIFWLAAMGKLRIPGSVSRGDSAPGANVRTREGNNPDPQLRSPMHG